MNDTILGKRQGSILQNLLLKGRLSRKQIEEIFEKEVSKVTVIRDLNKLIENDYIHSVGEGPATEYKLNEKKQILIPVDMSEYFLPSTDERSSRYKKFNKEIFKYLVGLFTQTELQLFERGKKAYTKNFHENDPSIIKRELERFVIELSWKSSQIEGNTYSLLETEELIKNKREAPGHTKEEAIMILNHKKAFDLILDNKASFRKISLADIRTIHSILVGGLEITTNIRKHRVGITGTTYEPLENQWQIKESLDNLILAANKLGVVEQSLVFLSMLSYIQPFADGNKRTARMVSNAILLSNEYFPLSYRSVDEIEYKKALIVFYELNSIAPLKKIFVEQQKFAIENYFK